MATDLATRGWQRAACPPSAGSAGYAIDANDLILLSRGYFAGPNNHSIYNHATGTFINVRYPYPDISATTYGGVFNKGRIQPNRTFARADVNIPPSTTFTVRSWLNPTNNANGDRDGFFLMQGIETGASLWLVSKDTSLELRRGSTTTLGTVVWTISHAAAGLQSGVFAYFTMTKVVNVLTFYVNGVSIGSYTISNATTSGITLQFTTSTNNNDPDVAGLNYFMDYQVSKVARDGAFVPGNVFGF